MEDIGIKYQLLPPDNQQEVQDFVDFLLTKRKKRTFNMKEWKRKIKNISVWSESDIKNLSKGKLKSWKPTEW